MLGKLGCPELYSVIKFAAGLRRTEARRDICHFLDVQIQYRCIEVVGDTDLRQNEHSHRLRVRPS